MYNITGFIHKNITCNINNKSYEIIIEIKRLNGRFNDVFLKTSSILNSFETDFINLLKKELKRGTTTASIFVEQEGQKKNASILNQELFSKINTEVQEFTKNINVVYQFSDLIALSEMSQKNGLIKKTEEVENDFIVEIKKKLLDTVKEFLEDSLKNGVDTKQNILDMIKFIHIDFKSIKESVKELTEKRKQDFQAKLQEIFNGINITKELFQEIFKVELFRLLEKLDVNEEINRFGSHLETITGYVLEDQYEKAKKIEFILQELGREINTLSVKSADTLINQKIMNIKLNLEKIREQIQNIV